VREISYGERGGSHARPCLKNGGKDGKKRYQDVKKDTEKTRLWGWRSDWWKKSAWRGRGRKKIGKLKRSGEE